MSKKQVKTAPTMKKSTKIAVAAVAFVLLAALITGIVLSNIDRSFRYDLEDLSVYFKDGATIDYDGLSSLPIKLETSVTEAGILDEIFTAVKKYSAVDRLKKPAADIRTDLPYNDIVYMYYEIYQWKDADGDDILDADASLLLSNTAYGDPTKATMIRLGSGGLHSMIEAYMLNHYQYGTTVVRQEDEGEELIKGYTLVIDLKGTYTETTVKNGETTTTTKDYITLTDFNLQLDPTEVDTENPKTYYQGATTLTGQATKITNHKISEEVNTLLMDEIRKVTTVGGKVENLKLDIVLSTSSSDATEVTFNVTVKKAFLAETKFQTFKLDSDDNPNRSEFKYKDSAAAEQTISLSETLALKITLENTISLDQRTVEYLTGDEDSAFKDFVAPTELGENPDHTYAAAFMKYVKDKLMAEAEADLRKEAASFESSVKSALWNAITEKYATDAYIDSFPARVVEEYVELLYQSYLAEYKDSSLTTYDSAAEYILVKIYEVEDGAKLSAEEQQTMLNRYLTEEAEEAIRKEILLFAVAKQLGVEYTSKALSNAENEIYSSVYASYVSYYTSLFGTQKDAQGNLKYSAADIARMAREDARAQSDALCTPSYLREYVAIKSIQDKLVPDATKFENITFVLKGELDK